MSKSKQVSSLAAFAEAHPVRSGLVCWVCSIPERAEIDQAMRTGAARIPQILRWLVDERGYPSRMATRPKVDSHFKSQHHVKAKAK